MGVGTQASNLYISSHVLVKFAKVMYFCILFLKAPQIYNLQPDYNVRAVHRLHLHTEAKTAFWPFLEKQM